MSDIIIDKTALNRLINNQIRRVLGEAPIAPQAPPPPPPAPSSPPPAPSPQTTQPPPGDGVNQVSMSKAAQSHPQDDELQKGNITIDMVIEKLNSIRSGRSFKDENIHDQMGKYFDALNDNERLALYAFLKGIAQIVTADIPAQNAPNPKSMELEINSSHDEGMKNIRHIKPNIIQKQTTTQSPQQQNNVATSPQNSVPKTNQRLAFPIVPKQRNS